MFLNAFFIPFQAFTRTVRIERQVAADLVLIPFHKLDMNVPSAPNADLAELNNPLQRLPKNVLIDPQIRTVAALALFH